MIGRDDRDGLGHDHFTHGAFGAGFHRGAELEEFTDDFRVEFADDEIEYDAEIFVHGLLALRKYGNYNGPCR